MAMEGKAQESNGRHPVLLVDSYVHGVSIGSADGLAEGAELRLENDGSPPVRLRSRYVAKAGEPLADLERHLKRMSARGVLRATTVIFGVTTDPFHPFDEKFATSMKFLEMFERYQPGRLIIQTRSPLIVIGLPVLNKVRRNTCIVVGIETPLDDVRLRYTPGLPSVEERWKTVRALKRFGLKVGVQVAPMLPYGDWRQDAAAFAAALNENADFITVRSLVQGAPLGRPKCATARMLARDRQFFYLRHDTHVPLTNALSALCEGKLVHPATLEPVSPQIPLFA
jgi:DNA repair photolyase